MISTPDLNDLREQLNLGRHRQTLRARPLFDTAILDRQYRPLRGLVWSVVVHFSLVAALASIPAVSASVVVEHENLDEAVIVDVDEFKDALFLPLVGVSDSPPTPEKKGVIYPGPQPVFSNFEKPTNQIQTILQPGLINPPRLQTPMALPNVVRLAEPSRPAPPPVEPKFRMPDTTTPVLRPPVAPAISPLDIALTAPTRPPAAPVIEPRFKLPEITTPINNPSVMVPTLQTDLALANLLTPPRPPAPKPPEPVSTSNGDAKQDLLVLSPTPARRDQPVAIPPGEARGQFSIAPDSNLSFPGTEPGTRGTATPTPAPEPDDVVKDRVPAPPRDTVTPPAPTNTPGAIRGIDAFEGITILGGIDTPASRNALTNRPNSTPEPLQTSYGITILATGGSGGGLPDFGVFGNESVQTVYLDMRRTIFDTPLSWTAQYAVGQLAVAAPIENTGILALKEDVVLPFPIDKHRPAWISEVARRHSGRMVIAYAVINAEGTLEQLSIKDSPDPLLNEPVLDMLRKWKFRPARRDGEVAPTKMLLGIPVL